MTVARVAALAALVVAVVIVAVLLLSDDGARSTRSRRDHTPASSSTATMPVGGRRIGSNESISLHGQQPGAAEDQGRRRLRAAAGAPPRSCARPRCRASRTVTSPSAPGRTALGAARRLRPSRSTSTTSIVDLDQLFNTLNPQPARACRTSSRARRPTTPARARRPTSGEVLQPRAVLDQSLLSTRSSPSSARYELRSSTRPTSCRRWPSAAATSPPWSATPTRPPARSPARTPALPRVGLLPGTLARRTPPS